MYLLSYVEKCTDKLKIFKTKKACDQFVIQFTKKTDEDSWVQFSVEIKQPPSFFNNNSISAVDND